MLRILLFALVAFPLLLLQPPLAAQKKKSGDRPFEKMDYGPFFTATISAKAPAKNIANKGLAWRIGEKLDAAVCFDMDLCRFVAGWTGDFIELRGTPFDGSHGPYPQIKGPQLFGSRTAPGWAKPGSDDFKDPRSEPYGPLPHEWARYKGLYLSGDKIVIHYTVGEAKVLESADFKDSADGKAIIRTINIEAHKDPLTHNVAEISKGTIEEGVAVGEKLLIGLAGGPKGAELRIAEGRVLLSLPASTESSAFRLVISDADKAKLPAFREMLKSLTGVEASLAKYLKGGKSRWSETITTKGVREKDDGSAYVVDTITVPEKNPYNAWMRFGGLDFFSDGRAALSTWSGDVWVVSGLDESLEKITWKRFASGLFQPLGLKIVGDKVYTLGREGIVRLHDLDGDGEADYYEAFNNDVATTPGFHEFAFDLHTDPEGNFYYAKGGPVRSGGSGFEYIARHSGCILKVSPDGKKHEVFATGLRAPNGIGVGPRGEVTSGDNEGTWMPQCRLSLVLPGSFNGCVDTAHQKTPPTDYDRPICWFPKNVDNSSGGQVWVTSKKFGPVDDRLLHMSYGQSSLYLVLLDGAGKEVQGGVVKMPIKFQTGVMRARFHPKDEQLYITGLRGWQTNAPRDGAFQRVRYTGKPFASIENLKVTKTGLELKFFNKLDPKSIDADSFTAQQWNYLWCSDYGSREYSTSTQDFDEKVKQYNILRRDRSKNKDEIAKLFKEFKQGRDKTQITKATLGADGKTVNLEIADFKPVMQMQLKYKLKTESGTALGQEVYLTINRVR